MPAVVAASLRRQAETCLRVSRQTADAAVRLELITAAALLHDRAARIEALLKRQSSVAQHSAESLNRVRDGD